MACLSRPNWHRCLRFCALVTWFKARKVPGVVIGGLAASLLGRPRLTRDMDMLVLVDQGQWAEFMAAGAKWSYRAPR